MTIQSSKFTGCYLILSSLFMAFLCLRFDASIVITVVGIIFGFLVIKEQLIAKKIVRFCSAFAAIMGLFVLLLGIFKGTKGVTYSLGHLFHFESPSLGLHVLLGLFFTFWFGIPYFALSPHKNKQKS